MSHKQGKLKNLKSVQILSRFNNFFKLVIHIAFRKEQIIAFRGAIAVMRIWIGRFQHLHAQPAEIGATPETSHLIAALGLFDGRSAVGTALAIRAFPVFGQGVIDKGAYHPLPITLLDSFLHGNVSVHVLFEDVLPLLGFEIARCDPVIGHLAERAEHEIAGGTGAQTTAGVDDTGALAFLSWAVGNVRHAFEGGGQKQPVVSFVEIGSNQPFDGRYIELSITFSL